MRRPLVAGNWKMNKTGPEARSFAAELRERLREEPAAEVAVCPPFTALEATTAAFAGSPVMVMAQAVHEGTSGAHTGEISAEMVVAAGAAGTLVGHSERRAAGETDEQVSARVRAALDAGLRVIVCVGESLQQREAGETEGWIARQVEAAFAEVQPEEVDRAHVAYEPIWAIGTGRTATPDLAQETCAFVRRALPEGIDPQRLLVLYGGSVTPQNAAELMAQPDIDGALVGGASLDVGSFTAIVHAAGG